MSSLEIEREILIDAPIEVVWRTLTEPDQISQWFADRVDLVVEPGAHGHLRFGDQGGPVVMEVVDPPSRFAFRWNYPPGEEPAAGNSMLVEFTLSDWPDAEKQRYADEHQGGWPAFLDRLAVLAAKHQRK